MPIRTKRRRDSGQIDAITNNMPGSNANTTVGQFNDWIKNFWAAHARQWTPDGNPTAQNLSDNFGDNLAKLNQIQDPGERERAINELHRTTSMASRPKPRTIETRAARSGTQLQAISLL